VGHIGAFSGDPDTWRLRMLRIPRLREFAEPSPRGILSLRETCWRKGVLTSARCAGVLGGLGRGAYPYDLSPFIWRGGQLA
jgi:hypothetical protein